MPTPVSDAELRWQYRLTGWANRGITLEAALASHPLRDATLIVSRGPFTVAGDIALMQRHGIRHLVTKNAGGHAAEAKLAAARELGLPVVDPMRGGVKALADGAREGGLQF